MADAAPSPSASTSANNASHAPRYAYARTLLGADTFDRVASARLLVVGAGGIGCELLKNLVLVGFGNIEIVDLDTIDLSNLNRQFLFQKQHIKKPKSIVAKQTASAFNPLVNITAHHANIKQSRFGIHYFASFDIVLNALDNLDARRWVNRMCIAARVPLVESGTTGFLGQVQPIQKDHTECYDCTAKPVPKTYPVCTIRSTPSTPIHCIVWAKSWLFVQLFGADDETEEQELDKAVADGEDAKEIDNLRKEARETRDIRAAMLEAATAAAVTTTNSDNEDNGDGEQQLERAARRVFDKVYRNDIQRLLGMEEMWKHRPVKPVPLDYDAARQPVQGQPEGDGAADEAQRKAAAEKQTSLKDQRQLSLRENVDLFASSLASLAKRAAANSSEPLAFDKDDDDALDFVTATSNLRSYVYSIEQKTRFQVKEMAGNIIPAIASTNAIIAGVLVLQAVHVLRARWRGETGVGAAKYVSLARTSQRMLTSLAPAPPNDECGVCRDVYVALRLDAAAVTLGEVVDGFVKLEREKGGLGLEGCEVETYEAARLLSDPDFDDNLGASLASLGVEAGKMLTVVDEDGAWQPVHLVVSPLREGETGMVLPPKDEVPPLVPKIRKAPTPQQDGEGAKGAEEEDDVVVVDAPVPQKSGAAAAAGSKRAREEAEEEGGEKSDAKRKRNDEADGEAEGKKRRHQGASEEEAIELD
ncbi:E1 ubiquitin-activating protein uba2 [Thecaphora frezii]